MFFWGLLREHKHIVKQYIEYAPKATPVFQKAYDVTENSWKGESSEMDINPHFKTLDRRPCCFHSSAAAGKQVDFL